jgi:hypothetical protein
MNLSHQGTIVPVAEVMESRPAHLLSTVAAKLIPRRTIFVLPGAIEPSVGAGREGFWWAGGPS